MAVRHEFQLFRERRFLPLFMTQFLGAFNDNFFKTSLIMLIAFGNSDSLFSPDTWINLCAALFIMPYFLFSAIAGQIADKFEKSRLIMKIKFIEVLLAIVAIIGFYVNSLILLVLALFLLGTQATFFGPLKYSILPQHLRDTELIGGNGMIEMGTFIAILLGTILAGLMMAIENTGIYWVSYTVGITAVLGFCFSLFIPKAKAASPHLLLDWNLVKQTYAILHQATNNRFVYYAMMGISWFWVFGSIFLTQTAQYTKEILGGDELVTTLVLISFSLGIGAGSASYEWLSNKKVELGFVNIAMAGLTLFGIDFALTQSVRFEELQSLHSFLSYWPNWRILLDGIFMGTFGGILMVPMYTLIQIKSAEDIRSRMVAANNIINAIFMTLSSFLTILILWLDYSIPDLFMLTALINGLIGIYLWRLSCFL